ncbi:hypothetical protein NDI47_00775 [Microcoleus vaginatus GB1-A2]
MNCLQLDLGILDRTRLIIQLARSELLARFEPKNQTESSLGNALYDI